MNHKLPVAIAALCFAAASAANAEEQEEKSALRANFRRVALEMSSTEVRNAELYVDNPNSELSSDSKNMIKGVFDFVLEYEQPDWQWNNSLFMEYGRTELKPVGEEDTTNEDADKILLSSDYNHKLWHLDFQDADAGPFAGVAYQTEFTKNNDAPRQQVARGQVGFKLFNGDVLQELYASAIGEYDFTYSGDEVTKSAYEIGLRAEKPISDQVKFQLEGYFRQYLSYSSYVETDLKYELSLTGRMDVKIYKQFSLAPYISYFQGKARGVDKEGSNFLIGLSFAYSDLFNL